MEAALRKSGHGDVTMEEKGVESNGDEEDRKDEIVLKVGSADERKEHGTDNMKPTSPEYKDLIRCGKQVFDCNTQMVSEIKKMDASSTEPNSRACSSSAEKNQDEQLETAKAEMGEVREENQRLRMHLDRIMKDYKTLQMQFYDIVQQEPPNHSTNTPISTHHEIEEPGLVSLRLGITDPHKDEKHKINPKPTKEVLKEKDIDEGLALGLHLKFDVSKMGSSTQPPLNLCTENSLEEAGGDASPPHKVMKRSGDDEVSEQNPTKKARVSVRVRCDAPTMNDGCQWRKYGQKIAKGNPCPRAYYRCTVAPTCPVRKQVQRCAEDMSILITTYEGTHNHPLSVSANAMASTTSAAARMLMSGSTSSGQSEASSSACTTTMATDLHGLNFYFSDKLKPKQFYLPNCNSSISSSPSYPTITLDLTSTSSTSSFHNKTPPNYNCFPPRFPSTNLNFSSLESNPLPVTWSSSGRVLNYGSNQVSYNRTAQVGNSLNFGTQPLETSHQPHMQRLTNPPPQHSLPPDAIAAATKAITSDPSFHSALAAALTSIIGTRGGCSSSGGGGDKFGQNSTLGEPFACVGNFPSTSNGDKCSSSYLNRTASITKSQSGSLMLPFSTPSKPKPTSPVDDKDHII